MDTTEISYEYNGVIYKIIGTEELHEQLNDGIFFQNYIATNVRSLEVEIPDEDKENWTWTKKSTLCLLDCLERRKLKLRNPKIKKKDLWKEIRNEMAVNGFETDESMIERKFRNMKGTFKTIKDNKARTSTGGGAIKWEYFQAMEKLFYEDRTINIGHTVSSFSKSCAQYTSEANNEATSSSHASEDNRRETHLSCVEEDDNTFSSKKPRLSITATNTTQSADMPVTPLMQLEQLATPTSSNSAQFKKQKAERRSQLYGLRKKQLDIEESRVKEVELLRLAIEESNRIQNERNTLLKRFLEQK